MNTKQAMNSKYVTPYKLITLILVFIFVIGNFIHAAPIQAVAQSVAQPSLNVAIIDSVNVRNGGSFPTTTTGPTGSFLDYNFYILPRANVSLAALGPGGACGADGCDTVLLNVASYGIACNLDNLTAQQKADLVSFVNLGRKLIIYDSECVAQDYSWLPYPFTTVNPGALGAQGTLTIVEENTLSSGDEASPYFINAVMLGTQTDAVGDMNVMTTYDPNWFLDMSGTNAIGYTGPVHTYATLPPGTDAGLIIYNGLDVDYMTTSTSPTSATPAGNLAKIWLQELQQLFNPSDLPGTNPVVGIILTPDTATLNVGTDHTVTATITDLLGEPQENIEVIFSVDSGPNVETNGTCSVNSDCTTDANGQVSFTYTGDGGIGTDQIKGCFTSATGQTVCSSLVTAEWIAATCEPNDPDFEKQWNMWLIDLVGALNQFPSCQVPTINIGVIDTGVDSDHTDLIGHIGSSYSVIGDSAEDSHGHGTGVAGIISAVHNDLYLAGIHPNSRLSIYRVTETGDMDKEDLLNLSTLIKKAVDDGLKIINISIAAGTDYYVNKNGQLKVCLDPLSDSCNGVLKEAVKYALDHKVTIVAGGPESMIKITDPFSYIIYKMGIVKAYPAAYSQLFENVIAVTASSELNTLSDYSVPTDYITVAAPGGNPSVIKNKMTCSPDFFDCVLNLNNDGGTIEGLGTSFAAPHVSGVVGLMLSANPNLTPIQIRTILEQTATPFTLPVENAGAGIVNAAEAVRIAFELLP